MMQLHMSFQFHFRSCFDPDRLGVACDDLSDYCARVVYGGVPRTGTTVQCREGPPRAGTTKAAVACAQFKLRTIKVWSGNSKRICLSSSMPRQQLTHPRQLGDDGLLYRKHSQRRLERHISVRRNKGKQKFGPSIHPDRGDGGLVVVDALAAAAGELHHEGIRVGHPTIPTTIVTFPQNILLDLSTC